MPPQSFVSVPCMNRRFDLCHRAPGEDFAPVANQAFSAELLEKLRTVASSRNAIYKAECRMWDGAEAWQVKCKRRSAGRTGASNFTWHGSAAFRIPG